MYYHGAMGSRDNPLSKFCRDGEEVEDKPRPRKWNLSCLSKEQKEGLLRLYDEIQEKKKRKHNYPIW